MWTQVQLRHWVDISLGTCTCVAGKDGTPCSHQSAVTLHFHVASCNIIPTLQPSCRRDLAFIAVGNKANNDIEFYASISQCCDEDEHVVTVDTVNPLSLSSTLEDCGIVEDEEDRQPPLDPQNLSHDLEVIDDLKARLDCDALLCSGVKKFLKDIIKWHLCSQQHCLPHFIVLALRAVQQHVYKVAVFEEVDAFQYRQLQQEDGSMALKERLLQLLVIHQKENRR